MQLEPIRTLLLAIELGSFSGAAGRLGVPPSTVSRRVAELEKELGCELVVRTGRGIRPASEAAAILAGLRSVLSSVEEVVAQASNEPPALASVRVAVPLEMGLRVVPEVLASLSEDFPEVLFEVHAESRRVGLVEEEVDLAVRLGRLSDSSFIRRSLGTLGLVLAGCPECVSAVDSIQALASVPLIEIIGAPLGLQGQWDERPFSLTPPAAARVGTFTSAAEMAALGAGLAILPTYVAQPYLLDRRLQIVGHVSLVGAVQAHALFPRRHRTQRVIRAFVDRLAAVLERRLPERTPAAST